MALGCGVFEMLLAKSSSRGLLEKASSPVAKKDLGFLAGLPFLALTSWLTDEPAWQAIARKAADHSGGILSRDPETIMARVSEVVGNRALALPPSKISHELVANEIETAFQVMRDHLPSRWRPSIEVIGEEHLKAALSLGQGAVLWDSHFYFASLVTKIGLHSIGYGLHHLSRREHGFSSTPFGMKFLNPIRTSVERRYLRERLVMPVDDPGSVLRVLAERLKQNAIVSITVRGWARRPVKAPFLDGWLAVAPGAPVLACKTGAKLIPVFTVRQEVGRYRIILGSPIEVHRDRSREEAVSLAAAEYTKRLERFVLDHPGQWIDWINI